MGLQMTRNIMFVCIFNVKRSVVAARFFQRMLDRKGEPDSHIIRVSSAGFIGVRVDEWFNFHGIPYPDPLFHRKPSRLIQEKMAERGLDITTHRSRRLTREMMDETDLVIPMLAELQSDLITAFPHARNKIMLPHAFLSEETEFLWADRAAVPNDHRMFKFAHNNPDYVAAVLHEIERFIETAFGAMCDRLMTTDSDRIKSEIFCTGGGD